jgi:hypothetical protein
MNARAVIAIVVIVIWILSVGATLIAIIYVQNQNTAENASARMHRRARTSPFFTPNSYPQ